jgi:GAF domain-containing protein
MQGKLSTSQAFDPKETTRTVYKNWREQFVLPLLVGTLIFGALILLPAINVSDNPVLDATFIAAYAATVVVTFIRFSYEVRITIFLFALYVIGMSELIRYSILGDAIIFFLGITVFATMLFSPKIGFYVLGGNAVSVIIIGVLIHTGQIIPFSENAITAKVEDWVSGVMAIVMFSVVIILGFRQLEQAFLTAQEQVDKTLNDLNNERAKLESKVAERTIKLRRVNEIGRTIASILNPDELLARATRLIGDEFECYFTAIYLTDSAGQWAYIKEATGDAGKVLRENKHRVDLKGKSIISAAIRTRQVRIALDSGEEPIRFDNPLLPYTCSQIVMPLAVGEQTIGALELQSTKELAFAMQDADTYQNMANEVAIALENARLYTEAQYNLAEMRATQRQYLQGAWQSLASEQRMEYFLGDKEGDVNEISVPLSLRDQIIGQIDMAGRDVWTTEQRNIIESVATQAALALENARLVEESQAIASRERLANEIISKVWSSTTMESILQTTVRELGRALEAAEVEIQISMDGKNE